MKKGNKKSKTREEKPQKVTNQCKKDINFSKKCYKKSQTSHKK